MRRLITVPLRHCARTIRRLKTALRLYFRLNYSWRLAWFISRRP